MKQTILVVEDDKMIRNLITLYLEKNNYQVVSASDGKKAKDVYENNHPCLIILDLMLPKLSGEEFCQWVREDKSDNETAILMLTAKTKVSDKITGLNLGADSYLTKPFDPEELIAQVQAVLRRTNQHCEQISYDGLTIKPKKGEVFLGTERINLTKHEFDLLKYLMQNPNHVFSREALVSELYAFHEQNILDRTIDAHIKKLREKIEDIPAEPKRIQTIRGMGYKFVTK